MYKKTKQFLFTVSLIAGMTANGVAADKLKSFDHAAELTSQAKTILFQELNIAKVPNSGHQQIVCLAENIYFEARAESMEGKAGVANVTRNRVLDKRWPSTYCEVVQQGPVRESWKTRQHADLPDEERIYYPRKHRCQFSWYCDGKKDIVWVSYMDGTIIEANMMAWRDSINVALFVMSEQIGDNTDGADHYYNYNISNPYWVSAMDETFIIGNHRFMKEKR